METTTNDINIIKSVTFSSYADNGHIKVTLGDGWVAHFHFGGCFGNDEGLINIVSVNGEIKLGKYRIPAHRMMTAFGFALKHPSAFIEALDAFATRNL